ncbi:hypothetical protein HIM_01976 [Hirsutella minnesotensis 3608]|nr:hypothetical protein HIM_01976 [Hirsutella minnesotensis 3608]
MHSTGKMPKKNNQSRPNISAPIGPIKSSRGPDLLRSEQFSIVDGIKDCEDPYSSASNDNAPGAISSSAAMSTRKVSAGFPNHPTQAASPTIASSSFHATAASQGQEAQGSKFLRKPSFPSFGKPKASKLPLPPSSTSSMLPIRAARAENAPPPVSIKKPVDNPSQPSRQTSKLPKSRTMAVLQDLKNSISRQNLGARFNEAKRTHAPSRLQDRPPTPGLPRNIPASEIPPLPENTSFSRIPVPHPAPRISHNSATTEFPAPWQTQVPPRKPVPTQQPVASTSESMDVGVARPPSQTTGEPAQVVSAPTKFHKSNPYYTPSIRQSDSSGSHSSWSATRDPDLAQVVTAQPIEYWTGRFSRLNDIYMGTDRAPETLLALRSGLLSQNRHSANTRTVSEEDARHLHIFAQLDFLCTTPEAKESLRAFQVTFARRHRRSILLPEGTTLGDVEKDRNVMARIFGSRRSSGDSSKKAGQRDSNHSSRISTPNAGSPHGFF